MAGDDETTIGELTRRLDRHERDCGVDHSELRATCAAQGAVSVNQGVYAAERNADRAEVTTLDKKVDALQGRVSWAWRTALTALGAPIVVAIVAFLARSGS